MVQDLKSKSKIDYTLDLREWKSKNQDITQIEGGAMLEDIEIGRYSKFDSGSAGFGPP